MGGECVRSRGVAAESLEIYMNWGPEVVVVMKVEIVVMMVVDGECVRSRGVAVEGLEIQTHWGLER